MRKPRWTSYSTERLVEEVKARSAKRGHAMREGPAREANRQFDILVAIHQEIRARGLEAQRQLLSLLKDPEPATQCWVAIYALEFAPEEAEPVLEEIRRTQKNFMGSEARGALEKSREGTLRLF